MAGLTRLVRPPAPFPPAAGLRRTVAALVLVALGVSALLLAGCGDDEVIVPAATTEQPVTLQVAGSGTAQPLIRLLAEAYEKDHPDVSFDFLPEMHSAGGIKGVSRGDFQIGLVSRPPKDEERALGLTYVVVSHDALALAANSAEVGVDNVTTEQVRAVYSGRITNWKELGGVNAEIVVLDRNEDESAKIILRQYVLGPREELTVTDRAVQLNQESDMVDGLVNTRYTFGYLSRGYIVSTGLESTIHTLSLDGVTPTVDAVESGAYPMFRPLGVVIRPDAPEAVRRFVDYLQGDEARQIMRSSGFAPAPVAR